MLKRLFRRNYGIAVRRVGVRSELAWYWRVLVWIGVLSVSIALAGWVYDAGRRIAGFDREEFERERGESQKRIGDLEKRLALALEDVRAGEGRLNVEIAAVGQLAAQIKAVQKENLALKEELALFEGLVSGARVAGANVIRVPRAVVERGDAGKFKYRLMLVHQSGQKSARDFSGEFRLEFKVRLGGRDVMISVPGEGGANSDAFRLGFRHIHRVEGEGVLPPGAEIISCEVLVLQGATVLLRQPVSF